MNATLRVPPILVLLAVLAPAPIAGAAPDTPTARAPRFTLSPAEITATANLTWNVDLEIQNTQAVGAYMDSVICLMEDQDSGETHAPRQRTVPIAAAAQAIHALSVGEVGEFAYSAPALFEKGRMTFTLFGHFGDGAGFVTSVEAPVGPGPVSAEHPSTLVEVGGRKVECVFFPSLREGGAPGLLLVHGDGSNARKRMAMALSLSARGYSVMLVSLPGYGASDGPADLSGPRTVAALGAALDRLKSAPGVDGSRVGAWGEDRGAGAVASLAAERGDLAAAVVQSGTYDLWAVYRGTSPELKQAILAEAGRDSSAWRARSPLTRAAAIHTPLLVIHGLADPVVPAEQARAFAAAVGAGGTPVETRFLEQAGHQISAAEANRAALTFLGSKLGR